jgi:lysophospholipase L1-like esterase
VYSKHIKTILAQAFVFLICMAIADLVLWAVMPVPFDRPQSAYKKLRQELPGLKKEIEYTRNEFGFRSISMRTRAKPPGVVRIFCLGASTTDQATQSTPDIWSSILETKLNEAFRDTGLKVETAAYGHGGTRTAELLSWARQNLLQFEPDIVITLVGINDLCLNGHPGYSYSGLAERLDTIEQAEREDDSGAWRKCREVSQICRRLDLAGDRLENWWKLRTGRRLQWHSKHLPNLRRLYREYPYVPAPVRDPDPIAEFSDALAGLLAFLHDSGIETIVLGQPVLWRESLEREEVETLWFLVATADGPVRPSLSWLEREMSRYNEVQRRQAELFGAAFVDLDERIPKSLDYYFDDCHFTDLGNERVAAEIFPVIKDRVLSSFGVKS